MKKTCENCLRRKNEDGSDCRFFNGRSQREKNSFLVDADGACGLWEAEPDRFYAVAGKGFIAFPHYPNDEEYETGKDGPLVNVKKIVEAYIKLNDWKRSVIIFRLHERNHVGCSTVLMPNACDDRKTITKLVKAMIPVVDFDSIRIDDLWYKSEEDFARAAAAPPHILPHVEPCFVAYPSHKEYSPYYKEGEEPPF